MPIPHGRTLSNWLRRYRAGAGGAITPQLNDVLTPAVLVDDVRHLISPFEIPVTFGVIRSPGPGAGLRAGIEITPSGGGTIVRFIEAVGALAVIYFATNVAQFANNRADGSASLNTFSGPPLHTAVIGDDALANFVDRPAAAYLLSVGQIFGTEYLIPPTGRLTFMANTDNSVLDVAVLLQDFPVS